MKLTDLIDQLWWYDSSVYSRTRKFHAKDDHWRFVAIHSWSSPTIFRGPVSTYKFSVEHGLSGPTLQEFEGTEAQLLYNRVLDKYEAQQREQRIELQEQFRQKFGDLEV